MIRLALVPLAPAARYLFGLPPLWVFLTGIAILAEWIRVATDALALHTGPAIGGLLTISLGSLAELILALFVLMRGEIAVVHAQITDSIMGTCLLGLGLAIVVGGFDKERQSFKRERAGLLSSMIWCWSSSRSSCRPCSTSPIATFLTCRMSMPPTRR